MSNTVTINDVVREAIALAKANPEFVYTRPDPDGERCFYVYDGQPSCIFGQALVKAGVDVKHLNAVESELHHEGNSGICRVLDRLGINFSARVGLIVEAAQSAQDAHGRWGHEVLAHLMDAEAEL